MPHHPTKPASPPTHLSATGAPAGALQQPARGGDASARVADMGPASEGGIGRGGSPLKAQALAEPSEEGPQPGKPVKQPGCGCSIS